MIAALGMYDRAELRAPNDALWDGIRAQLGFGPSALTRDQDFWDIWRAPDLLMAQTCGLPYRAHLHEQVQLIGTPDYGVQGCEPGYYRSAIVVRKSQPPTLADLGQLVFAYNEAGSQSGWAAFWDHVGADAQPKDMVQSGAHVQSARLVAEGRADIAALDWVTWQMVQRYDTFADDLMELTLTRPTPGLPLITAPQSNRAQLFDATRAAIAALAPEHKDHLLLRDLVHIPKAAYLAEPLPDR